MAAWLFPPSNRNLLDDIEVLDSDVSQPVRNQHVVSRVLLKGFAAPDEKGKGLELVPFDLQRRRPLRPLGLRGCAKVPDFITYASGSLELLWKQTEDKLGEAIQVAHAGKLKPGDAASDVLKDGLALHFVRSIRYLTIQQASFEAALREVRTRVIAERSSDLAREFHVRTGLYPAGQGSLEAEADAQLDVWRQRAAAGKISRQSLENMYERVRATLRPLPLEVGHVPPDQELLISDAPAFAYRYEDDSSTIGGLNLPIGDSNGIAMPIGPDCLISTGGESMMEGTLMPAQVGILNVIQIRVAHKYVYYARGSHLEKFVLGHLTERDASESNGG